MIYAIRKDNKLMQYICKIDQSNSYISIQISLWTTECYQKPLKIRNYCSFVIVLLYPITYPKIYICYISHTSKLTKNESSNLNKNCIFWALKNIGVRPCIPGWCTPAYHLSKVTYLYYFWVMMLIVIKIMSMKQSQ